MEVGEKDYVACGKVDCKTIPNLLQQEEFCQNQKAAQPSSAKLQGKLGECENNFT